MSDLSDNDDRMSLSDPEEPQAEPQNEEENKENAEDGDDAGRRIDPSTSKKKIVRKPLPKLDLIRLKGPKGLRTIEKYFEGFKFHGAGHEATDLDRIMKRLEHWAHRLYPKYRFDDFLEKVEALGSKKELQTYLTKYRRDMLTDDQVDEEGLDNVDEERYKSPEPVDEFDLLIAEQIEKTRQATSQQPKDQSTAFDDLIASGTDKRSDIDEEVRERMERNRQAALERKMAKMREKQVQKPAEAPETVSQNSQVTASQLSPRQVTLAGPDDDFDILIEEEMESTKDTTAKVVSQEPPVVVNIEKTPESKKQDEDPEDEIKKRIERNRQLALERKMARLKQKEAEKVAESSTSHNSEIEQTSTPLENPQVSEKEQENAETAVTNNEVIMKTPEVLKVTEVEEKMDTEDKPEEPTKFTNEENSNIPEEDSVPSSTSKTDSNPTMKLLTDQELDDEIGAALKMFMKGKRSSL